MIPYFSLIANLLFHIYSSWLEETLLEKEEEILRCEETLREKSKKILNWKPESLGKIISVLEEQ